MTIALYIYEHVPLAITGGLRNRGVDILTVQAEGRRGDSDTALLDRALELRRVMFSQDEDFPIEAARRQTAGIDFAGIIYARQTAVSVGNSVRDLEIIAKVAEPEDFFNQIQYLPL